MKSPLLLALLLPATALAAPAAANSTLARALPVPASFDTGLDADFARGEKTAYIRTKTALVPAALNDELKLAAGAGRFGGALHFPKKGNTRPLFKDGGTLGYNGQSWSATVSVWLRLDPEKDLEPGYCDPVQIVGDGLGPAGLRRLEVGLRGGDDLDQFLAEQRHVARIGVGAEAAH